MKTLKFNPEKLLRQRQGVAFS